MPVPHLVGEVELDASIMDGATGGRRGRRGDRLPAPGLHRPGRMRPAAQHVMLAGAGAERFADEAGFARGPTLTEEARQMWQDGLTSSGLAAAGAWPRPGPGMGRAR